MKPLSPFIAAQLLNAYYSAMVLRQLHGDQIESKEVSQATLDAVFHNWEQFTKLVDQSDLSSVGISETLLSSFIAKHQKKADQED